MGHCHCCPLFPKYSTQTDSIDNQSTLAVKGQIQMTQPPRILPKKINKKTLQELQRQESSFFQNNPAVEGLLHKHDTPLMPPLRKQPSQLSLEQSSYYSKIKRRIKPQLNKVSTMDDDSSNGSYYLDTTSVEGQVDQCEQKRSSIFQRSAMNLSFSHPPPPFLMPHQYCTLTYETVSGSKEHVEQLQKMEQFVNQETVQEKQLCQHYIQLAISKMQQHDFSSSQIYIVKILALLDQNTLNSIDPFKPYILAGSLYLIQNKASESLKYLLKALRQQISQRGTASVRLVQAYYWLGEAYLKVSKHSLSKDYFSKAYRLYQTHEVKQVRMLVRLCIELGNAYHRQEEFAQADRFYEKGLVWAEEGEDFVNYLKLLLKSAQNHIQMESYKQSLSKYSKVFHYLKLSNNQDQPFYQEALSSLSRTLQRLSYFQLRQPQLRSVVQAVEQISPDIHELQLLKIHLPSIPRPSCGSQ